MRRPVQTKAKKANLTLVEKPVLPPRSLEKTVEDLSHQATALRMAAEGYSHREIADELSCHFAKIPKLLAEGLEEYHESRNKAADKFFGIHRRRYDLLLQTWMPKARGWTELVVNEDGAHVEVVHPPDAKAAMIVAKLQADYSKMFGFNKLRVEHTGAHGGPIMNVNIDWSRATDEQLAQVKAGNADVIRQLSGAPASSGPARDPSEGDGED
jgi:hypothetical protein